MREIKFRCYSEQDKIMYRPLVLEVIAQLGHNFSDNIKLMQYTGLKDKNGVEIYEGDIIKDGSRLWKIEISPIYGIFFILTKGGHSRCYGDFGSYLADEFKVIGNIYENPELLN